VLASTILLYLEMRGTYCVNNSLYLVVLYCRPHFRKPRQSCST
jgi:hypothetical protein